MIIISNKKLFSPDDNDIVYKIQPFGKIVLEYLGTRVLESQVLFVIMNEYWYSSTVLKYLGRVLEYLEYSRK